MRLSAKHITSSDKARHGVPKLVFQQIVAHVTKPAPRIILMGWYDPNGAIIFETLNTFRLKPHVLASPLFYLAILNSRFMAWYVHRFVFNLSVRTMMFRVGYVEGIPLPRVAACVQQGNGTVSPEQEQAVGPWVESEIPGGNDGVPPRAHDYVVSSAQRMLYLNSQLRGALGRFLSAAEGQTHVSLADTLSKMSVVDFFKTDVANSLFPTFEEAIGPIQRAGLRKARSTTGGLRQGPIHDAYQRLLDEAGPMREELMATDARIDQIVHNVYHLTEEDLALIYGDARASD